MREKRTFAQEYCVKSAGKAMQQLHMVQPGSRIGIAVSGGVDSFVLLKCLHIRQGIVPFPFAPGAPARRPRPNGPLIWR